LIEIGFPQTPMPSKVVHIKFRLFEYDRGGGVVVVAVMVFGRGGEDDAVF